MQIIVYDIFHETLRKHDSFNALWPMKIPPEYSEQGTIITKQILLKTASVNSSTASNGHQY